MEWIKQVSSIWQEWILLSLPGAVIVYILVELLIRYGRFLSVHLRYWILIGVLIKCVLPPLLWIPLPVLTPEPEPELVPITNYQPVMEFAVSVPSPVVTAKKPIENGEWFSWQETLFLVQMAGTLFIVCFLVFKISKHGLSKLRMKDEEIGALCGSLCERMGMRMPGLYISPTESGACTCGLISPYIVLPQSLLNETQEYQNLVLMHELIHIQRKDHVMNWLQVGVFVIFWWHPIVWRVNYLIRCEREHCCDEQVLKELAIAPIEYTKLLVDAAEKQILHDQFQWQTAFANPAHAFQKRIRRIMTMNTITKKYTALGLILAGTVVVTMICGFHLVQAQDQKNKVNRSLEDLERITHYLNLFMENGEDIPDDLFQSITDLSSEFNQYIDKNYTAAKLQGMRSSLDFRIRIGNDMQVLGLHEILDRMKEFVRPVLRDQYDLTFVYDEGVDPNTEISVPSTSRLPSIAKFLDQALAPTGLMYKELGDGQVLIYKNSNPPKPSKLNTVIEGGVSAPNIPLEDVMALLQAQTGVDMILGEGVGKKTLTINLQGDPTLKEILDSVLPAVGLAYTVKETGVIWIDKAEIINPRITPRIDLKTRQFRVMESTGNTPEAIAKREAKLEQIIYVLSIMLYGYEGFKKAALEGRQLFLNPEHGTIDVIDTDENIKKVEGYLESVSSTTQTSVNTNHPNLEKVINGGIQASNEPLEDVINLLKSQLGFEMRLVDRESKKNVNINLSGDPTVKEILEHVLPSVDLAYIVLKNGTILIGTNEVIEVFNQREILRQESMERNIGLYKKIPEAIVKKNMTVSEFIKLIKEKIGVEIKVGKRIGEKKIDVNLEKDSTVKDSVMAICTPFQLGYSESTTGVIYIDTGDKIGIYPNNGTFTEVASTYVISGTAEKQNGVWKAENIAVPELPEFKPEFVLPSKEILKAYFDKDDKELDRIFTDWEKRSEQQLNEIIENLSEEDAKKEREERQKRMELRGDIDKEEMRKSSIQSILRSFGEIAESNIKQVRRVLDDYQTHVGSYPVSHDSIYLREAYAVDQKNEKVFFNKTSNVSPRTTIDQCTFDNQSFRYHSNGSWWVLAGNGPDFDVDYDVSTYTGKGESEFKAYLYNQANGIESSGDVIIFGP